MDFTPQIGILIRHMYLWRDEARQGREEGRKETLPNSPCAK